MTTAAAQPLFTIDARIGEAIAMAGLLPAGVQGAIQERTYDLLSHHRLSVIKHHDMPSGRPAQQMLATRLYRWTRVDAKSGRIAQILGEGFAAAESGEIFGKDNLKRLEFGGTVTSGQPMAIPTGAGRVRQGGGLRTHASFEALQKARGFDVSPTGALFSNPEEGSLRTVLWGVLRRSRRQPAQLGYYKRWEDVQSRHVGKFEKDLALAMTAAGRVSLERRTDDQRALREIYLKALRAYLEAHPGRHRDATRVAAGARKAARAQGLHRPGARA